MDEKEREQLQANLESDEAYRKALAIMYMIAIPVGILILALLTGLSGK